MIARKITVVALVRALLVGISPLLAGPPDAPPVAPTPPQPPAAAWKAGPASPQTGPQLTLKYCHAAPAIAFSPNSRLLATCSGRGVVRLTDVRTGRLVRIGGVSIPTSLAFSPDGKFLVARTNMGKVEVLDTRTLLVEKVLPVTEWSIYALAVSPDSAALACCAADGTVQLWDLKSAKKLQTFGAKGQPMGSLAFSPDGKLLAALTPTGRCNVWNIKTGNLAAGADRLRGYDESVRFSRDGARLAIASGGYAIDLWNFAKDERPARILVPDVLVGKPRINGPSFPPEFGRPMDAPLGDFASGPGCISGDLRTVACALENGSIAIWDIASRRVRKILPSGRKPGNVLGGILTVAFSPDGRLLAVVSVRGDVDVWRIDGKVEAAAVKQPIDADEWPGPWGQALNGLRTRLILKPVKPGPEALQGSSIDPRQVPVSEGIWWELCLQVRNETNKQLTFPWPGAIVIAHEDGRPVRFRSPDGRPVTFHPIAGTSQSMNAPWVGPNGDITTIVNELLGRNYDMSRPGKYRLQFPKTEADSTFRAPMTNPVLPASNVLEFDNIRADAPHAQATSRAEYLPYEAVPSAAPRDSRPPVPPAANSPTCVAIMEAEVVADLPAEDRKALAGAIDTILTESLAGRKGIQMVDRQTLDKVLAEKAGQAAGLVKVAPTEVAERLRPFWSAGVLICPVVRQLKAGKRSRAPGTRNNSASCRVPGRSPMPELVIEVEAVLAQTGQSLGEVRAAAKWQGGAWEKPPSLDSPLGRLWSDLPGNLQQAGSTRYVEIADVRLTSSLGRLQWMADDVGDLLRVSLARPGVALLRPRHPLSTKEERLLRVMGLAAPRGNDPAAGLACSPDFRLDAELLETVGKDLDYARTPIKLRLSLQGRAGPSAKQTFAGMAAQYRTLGERASAWLNTQLAAGGPPRDEVRDQEYSRQLAGRELEAARQLEKLCGGWYASEWHEAGPEQALRARVLGHAMRAAHLDPANEEAARLVVLGIDSRYWLRGHGRSNVCYDRVIAEGERYLERFGKSPHAEKVQGKISSIAFQWLTEARQAGEGDWTSLPPNPDVWRHAKVALLNLKRDALMHANAPGNLWCDASLVGEAVLIHCPPDRLEEERSYWRGYWKKTVEPLGGDAPPWDFIDIYYYIRKKDCASLRAKLSDLARRYPRSHEYVWGGTRPWVGDARYNGQPIWKVTVRRWLEFCGDPEFKTWLPSFPAETYDWNPWGYAPFLARFNPGMPEAWGEADARPLPAARVTFAYDRPETLRAGFGEWFRPLLSAGGFLWLCQPRPGERLRRGLPLIPSDCLFVIPMAEFKAEGQELHVKAQTIDWPPHPAEGRTGTPGKAVRCWLATIENHVPTVWIGTAWHGLARFEWREGKWQGRWYTAKQGVPGQDILAVRPCLYDGKPEVLVLSQSPPPLGAQALPMFLWALDPSDGKIRSVVTGKSGGTLVWKDGDKVPLCAYDRRDFPNLDARGIVGLDWQFGDDFMAARDGAKTHLWGLTAPVGSMWDGRINGSLSEYDGRMSPRLLLDGRALNRDVYYTAPGLARDLEGLTPYRYHYRPSTEGRFAEPLGFGQHTWQVLRAPLLNLQCCSDDPAVIWGTVPGEYGPGGGSLLAAYRPATKTPLVENDAWYGPWRTDMAIESLDFIDGDLWLVTADSHFYRFQPAAALRSARAQGAVRSTAQWRPEYRRRLESSWPNAVRMYIATREFDKARATTAAARRELHGNAKPGTPPCHLDLWEALASAQQGDYAAADRLYLQIADDPQAEPFARGLALVSLVGVRYAAKNWPGVEQALDKLAALFPENRHGTSDWYRQRARQNLRPSKPAIPVRHVDGHG